MATQIEPTAPDRTAERTSDEWREHLRTLHRKLEGKREQLIVAENRVEELRDAIGRAIAEDEDAGALRKQLRDAEDEAEGLERACEVIGQQIADGERSQAAAVKDETIAHAETMNAEAEAERENLEAKARKTLGDLLSTFERVQERDRAARQASHAAARASLAPGEQYHALSETPPAEWWRKRGLLSAVLAQAMAYMGTDDSEGARHRAAQSTSLDDAVTDTPKPAEKGFAFR